MREEPWSGGMGKWSRFSLGCKVCDNYLRKHREGRAGLSLDPTATAGSLCAAAAGLEHDFTALPNPSVPHSFLPRNSRESIPDPTCHLGFSLLLVLNCSRELLLLQTQDFRQLLQV